MRFSMIHVLSVVCIVLLLPVSSLATVPADVDGSQDIGLGDTITALQILSNLPVLPYILLESDINGNNRIDSAEALLPLQVLAETREMPMFWYKDADYDYYSDGSYILSPVMPDKTHFLAADLFDIYGDEDDSDPENYPDTEPKWIQFYPDFPEPTDPNVYQKGGGDQLYLEYTIFGINVSEVPEKDGTYHSVSIGEDVAFNDIPGQPRVPMIKHFVGIPYYGAEVGVEIDEEASLYEDFTGYRIHPAQYPYPEIIDPPQLPFVKDEKTYATDAFYPQERVPMERVVIRGADLRLVRINPVQYNPVTGITRVYTKLALNMTFEGGGESFLEDPRFICPPYEEFLQRVLVNWEQLIPQPIPRSEGAELLIITHSDFLAAANTLKSWKVRKGFSTLVKTEADVGTAADDIADYIQKAYNTWEVPPAYVLIIGDAEFIPCHYVTDHTFYGGDIKVGTDLYYATVHGTDYFPDIFIGRLSVDTLEEADTRVNNIIDYEQIPTSNQDYYTHAAICGQFQHDSMGYAQRRFAQTSEDLAIFLGNVGYAGHNYTIDRFYWTPSSVTPEYWKKDSWNFKGPAGKPADAIPGNLLKSAGFGWDATDTDISDAINEGRFLVTHRDHGSRNGWGSPGYSTSDVDNLSNGDMLPVVWSINCETGWFDNETDNASWTSSSEINFSEAWERNPEGGAVGVIAASRVSYSYHNDRLVWGWTDAIWPDFISGFGSSTPLYEMGPVLNYGKCYYGQKTNNDTIRKRELEMFHWFGDPTMEIWTDVPIYLKLVQIGKVYHGNSHLTVNMDEPGALITVSIDDEIIGQEMSAEGETTVNFNVKVQEGQELVVTVNKHNYVPHEEVITVELGR